MCLNKTEWSRKKDENFHCKYHDHYRTPCSRVRLEKLILTHLVKKFPHFMQLEYSLACSKSPPPVLTLSQINSVHTLPLCLFKIHLNTVGAGVAQSI
jgi:uncharacterized protein (DUF2132 family)